MITRLPTEAAMRSMISPRAAIARASAPMQPEWKRFSKRLSDRKEVLKMADAAAPGTGSVVAARVHAGVDQVLLGAVETESSGGLMLYARSTRSGPIGVR